MLRQQRRRLNSPTMARVCWRIKETGYAGHGEPVPIGIAHSHVSDLNRRHRDMYHHLEEIYE